MTARLVTHAVVAHVQRRPMAERLAEQTQARIFWDDGSLGEQRNHARALAWLAQQRTPWVSLLEDDAVPCADYIDVQAHGLADAPARHLISEYLGTGRWAGMHDPRRQARRVRALVDHAERSRRGWVTADALWHAVAVTMPSDAARDAVHALDARTPTDQALTRWVRRTGWRVAYSYPSWVDHADVPSVAEHPDRQPRTQSRHAWRFIDA